VTIHPPVAAEERTSQPRPAPPKDVLVALAGQPNVGKSTIFNLLTGLNQHVGNWPGKTVERKEGTFVHQGTTYRLVDLPGTYSLTANSAEEVVAREFIIRERPDLIIVVVNASSLERSLYLVAELIALPVPIVVALNMMDVARQEGIQVQPDALEAALGVRVVPMSAAHGVGMRDLVAALADHVHGVQPYNPQRPQVRADHQQLLDRIRDLIADHVPAPYPPDWVALKLLEGDQEIGQMMQAAVGPSTWTEVEAVLRAHDDALVAVASGRYEWIGRLIRAAVIRPKAGQIGLTERLDRWAAHPLWGLVFLAGVLGLIFWLTYAVGSPLQGWLDAHVVRALAELARAGLSAWGPPWVASLVADGIIGSLGFVLTFLPILAIFFAVMGTLEDVGYMARAAYVMDGFMHLMGLHGKSFLPLFLGFGCNVPAVLGTRVIESRQARLLTILLVPLIPCTARMAVVVFLAAAFFGRAAALVAWGMVLGALVILALSGMLINRFVFRGQRAAFIMELPLYHLPNPRTIGILVWQRVIEFVRKAGSVILPVSLGIWLLGTLPYGSLETSLLAMLGRWLEPAGRLVGFDWRLIVALLSSFIAKENSIATLSLLLGAGHEEGLAQVLASTFTPATGLAYITMQVLFIPCVATVAAIRQETRSWRWTLFSIAFLLVVSWAAAALVFLIARTLGL
jgi:ferrous iron transport protein B